MNFIRLANIQLYYAQSIWHNCTHVQTYLKSYILAEQSSPTVNIHLSSSRNPTAVTFLDTPS